MKSSKFTMLTSLLALLILGCVILSAQSGASMTKQEQANLKLVEEWWRTVLVPVTSTR